MQKLHIPIVIAGLPHMVKKNSVSKGSNGQARTHFSTEASRIFHNGYYVTMLGCFWQLGLSHGWSASKALNKTKYARKGTFLWHYILPNTVGNTDRLGSHFHKQILNFLNLKIQDECNSICNHTSKYIFKHEHLLKTGPLSWHIEHGLMHL